MPLSEVKVPLHCHMLLLNQCLSAEELTQVTFWWLHDLLQVGSTPSIRHWTRPHSPIQNCSPVFWPAETDLALALLRAVFLHVLAPTRSAAGHSQCCRQTITLMPRWLEWGGPQPAPPSLSQGTPTQLAQPLLVFELNFCGGGWQDRNKMQNLNHANTTPNSKNINYMLPFY